MTGRIFDIKRFAIHDGPGIRTTVFLKGCPLHCRWCQNPEGLDSGMGLWIKGEQCIRCGTCAALCPSAALSMTAQQAPKLNRDACSFCWTCTDNCPSRAIHRIDTEISAEALVQQLLLDKLFYDVSGGGVTLSGGEPLAQPDFSLAVLELLKEKGVHTCMETSLFAPEPVMRKIAGILDYLICDIKLINDETHRTYTGESNKIILDNFSHFASVFPGVLVRVPLIPGITATEENLRAVGEFVRTNNGKNINIELLNYNWLSASKYTCLDKPQFNSDARAFPEEMMARFYSWVSP